MRGQPAGIPRVAPTSKPVCSRGLALTKAGNPLESSGLPPNAYEKSMRAIPAEIQRVAPTSKPVCSRGQPAGIQRVAPTWKKHFRNYKVCFYSGTFVRASLLRFWATSIGPYLFGHIPRGRPVRPQMGLPREELPRANRIAHGDGP